MAVSRSARLFLRRYGLHDEQRPPSPRLSLDDLLVQRMPLPQGLPAYYLRRHLGHRPPDRPRSRPEHW